MKIIISPAKRMIVQEDFPMEVSTPRFIKEAMEIWEWMRKSTKEELITVWKCNKSIADENIRRLKEYEMTKNLTPAIIAYEGIQYQYMAPAVFEEEMLSYVNEHVRILSGVYGMLKPLDGVIPYRLEMQAKAPVGGAKDLYHYWGRKLYDALEEEGGEILNLASKEYYKCIEKYKSKDTKMITCVFAEESKGKLVQKGTYAKMARGEMVRFMSEKKITRLEEIREFDRLEFKFSEEHSDDFTYTFLRNPVK